MSVRADVDQVLQIGTEYTPGNRVAATRRLPGVSIQLNPQAETQRFRARGYNIDTTSVIHKIWANGTWEGICDFNSIVYPLAGMIGLIAPGTPVQIGATAGYTWDFNPVSSGADPNSKTFTVEEGDSEAAMVAEMLRFQSFGMVWGNDNLTMNGNLFGRFPIDDESLTALTDEEQLITKSGTVTGGVWTITYDGQETTDLDFDATNAEVLAALEALSNLAPGDVLLEGGPVNTTPLRIIFQGTLKGTNVGAVVVDSTGLTGGGTYGVTTPVAGGAAITEIAQRPVSRMQLDIFVDDTFGAIGTTKVAQAYAGDIMVGDKFQPFWALNTDFESFADTVRVPAQVNSSFTTAHNASSRALFNAVKTNPWKFIRMRALGENIGSAADELIQVDISAKFGTPEKQTDENGPLGFKFNFNVQHNADMGGAYKIKVVNRLTQL